MNYKSLIITIILRIAIVILVAFTFDKVFHIDLYIALIIVFLGLTLYDFFCKKKQNSK